MTSDCLTECVGKLMGLQPDRLPVIPPDADDRLQALRRWLNSQGWDAVVLHLNAKALELGWAYFEDFTPRGSWIAVHGVRDAPQLTYPHVDRDGVLMDVTVPSKHHAVIRRGMALSWDPLGVGEEGLGELRAGILLTPLAMNDHYLLTAA